LPRSVLGCLGEIEDSLAFVGGGGRRSPTASSPLRTAAKLSGTVEFADLASLFTPPTGRVRPPLGGWLDQLAADLGVLSTEISDHYLHHQAFNILR
jgi:uncharacterized alpha-E superfamily protein